MYTPWISHRFRTLALPSRYVVTTGAFILAAACGGSVSNDTPTGPGTPVTPVTPAPIATTSVSLQNSTFNPADIQVSPGATVTFTNNDGINHTVTFDNASISSIDAYTTGAKTVTMPTAAGTYAYHCNFHGAMKGTVVVK
jgi:plastocyanin